MSLEIQTQLRRLLHAGKFQEFKNLMEEIKVNNSAMVNDCLYGTTYYGGYSLLFIAALMKESAEVIDYLIDECGANVNYAGKNGQTAIFYAVKIGCATNLKKLMMKGADMHIVNNDGFTCMHILAAYYTKKCAELLFSTDLRIDSGKITPIQVAKRFKTDFNK